MQSTGEIRTSEKGEGGMIIFAIDPGTTRSAWVLWDSEKDELLDKGIEENSGMFPVISKYKGFSTGIIEMIASYGMPVGKEVFETCLWIGRFLHEMGVLPGMHEHYLVYRKDVKLNLCGSARAKDGNIRQALIDRFGAPGVKKKPGKLYGVSKDVWAALAVAVTYADRETS